MTLIEMLVSVAITLIVILAIVQTFSFVGRNVRSAQAVMEVSNELRGVARQIQADLDSATCPARTWIDPEAGLGYMEFVEGRLQDRDFLQLPDGTPLVTVNPAGNQVYAPNAFLPYRDLFYTNPTATPPTNYVAAYDSSFGDLDDFFALTIRSDSKPFTGRDWNGNYVQSHEAEVIYWTAFLDSNLNGLWDASEPIMLMRRQLLILPALGSAGAGARLDVATGDLHDISVRPAGPDTTIPNSLGELTHPTNRPMHVFPAAFPRFVTPQQLDDTRFYGRFVVLRDLRAFDLRVYDPRAPILQHISPGAVGAVNTGLAIAPGDPGYPELASDIKTGMQNQLLGLGAFVDMGYAVPDDNNGLPAISVSSGTDAAAIGNWYDATSNTSGRISYFSGIPGFKDANGDGVKQAAERIWTPSGQLITDSNWRNTDAFWNVRRYAFRYDTWSTLFERDGFAADGSPITTSPGDLATNGLDDNNFGGVDDPTERDTGPPYDVPLRGVEVRLRMLHFETRQVRQVSVVSDFVPE